LPDWEGAAIILFCLGNNETASKTVVAVAQLVESRIVIPVVVGSSPISHPKNSVVRTKGYMLLACSPFVFWKINSKFWKIIATGSSLLEFSDLMNFKVEPALPALSQFATRP
jgi:hypothetical protein